MSHQTPSTMLSSGGFALLTIVTEAGTIQVMGAASILGTAPVSTSATVSTLYIAGANSQLFILADEGTATAVNGILNIQSPFPTVVNTTASMNTTLVNVNLIPVNFGGTGRISLMQNHLLYGEGTGPVGLIAPGIDGQVLLSSSSGPPAFVTITSSGNTLTYAAGPNTLDIRVNTSVVSSQPLPVNQGGLGETGLTTFGVLIGSGSLPVNATNPGANGEVLIAATNGDPAFSAITSFASTITFSVGYNSLNMDVNLGGIPLLNPLPLQYGSTGQTVLTTYGVLIGEGSFGLHVTDPGVNGEVLIASSTGDPKFAFMTSILGSLTFSYGYNTLNIDLSNVNQQVSFLPLEEGSTGRSVLTAFGVLIGEGSLPVHVTDPGANGQLLLAATNGDPRFASLTSFGNTVLFTPGYNSLDLNVNINAVEPSTPLPVNFGGTGQSVLTTFGVLIGEGSLPIHATAPGIDGQALISSSIGDPAFMFISSSAGTLSFTTGNHSLDIALNLSSITFLNPLPIGGGGTGSTLLTAFGVLIGEGSLVINSTDPGTDGQILIASSTGDPAFGTITSMGGTIAFTSGPNSLNLDFNGPINLTVQANNGSADFSGGVLDILGEDPITTFGTGSTLFVLLDRASSFFNPLSPGGGGTGLTILTTFGVLIGEGNSPIDVTEPGLNGQVLIASSLGDPLFATITSSKNSITFQMGINSLNLEVTLQNSDFVSPLPVSNGGTGQTVFTMFGVLVGEGQNPIDATTAGFNGEIFLAASGSDPAFALLTSFGGTLSFTAGYNSFNLDVNLGNGFFNVIPVSNGGTGQTILTSFGVLIGEGQNPVDATIAGQNGQVLIGATGFAPAFQSLTSTGNTLTFQMGYNSLNIEINQTNVTFSFSPSSGGTGQTILTTFGVLVGEGQNPIHVTASGQNGEVLIASSMGDPAFSSITSTGNTLSFHFGYNTLNIELDLASSPSFNPLQVSNGGTGNASLSPYAVLAGGITNVSALQMISTPGSAGQILTSNGVGSLPSFQTFGAGNFQTLRMITFTSLSPTVYIPSLDAKYSVIECVGGGGGGGGANASNVGAGGGGGAGGYIKIIAFSNSIGTPLITIGTGGAGGIGANPGAQGGTTSVGALMSGFGGAGGQTANINSGGYGAPFAYGGNGATGSSAVNNYLAVLGNSGESSFGIADIGGGTGSISGSGAPSYFGGGSLGVELNSSGTATSIDGITGSSFGSGGSGAVSIGSSATGGNGANGIVIITEYA